MCEGEWYESRLGGCRASGPYSQHTSSREAVTSEGSRLDPGEFGEPESLVTTKEVGGPPRPSIHRYRIIVYYYVYIMWSPLRVRVKFQVCCWTFRGYGLLQQTK